MLAGGQLVPCNSPGNTKVAQPDEMDIDEAVKVAFGARGSAISAIRTHTRPQELSAEQAGQCGPVPSEMRGLPCWKRGGARTFIYGARPRASALSPLSNATFLWNGRFSRHCEEYRGNGS